VMGYLKEFCSEVRAVPRGRPSRELLKETLSIPVRRRRITD